MTDDCSDVTTMCDTIGRSSLIVSLTSHVGAGSRLHDFGGASMTIVLISSGVGRAKEDSFDVQQLLIYTCFSPFVTSELRDNSRHMLLIFSEKWLENRPDISASDVCVGSIVPTLR